MKGVFFLLLWAAVCGAAIGTGIYLIAMLVRKGADRGGKKKRILISYLIGFLLGLVVTLLTVRFY